MACRQERDAIVLIYRQKLLVRSPVLWWVSEQRGGGNAAHSACVVRGGQAMRAVVACRRVLIRRARQRVLYPQARHARLRTQNHKITFYFAVIYCTEPITGPVRVALGMPQVANQETRARPIAIKSLCCCARRAGGWRHTMTMTAGFWQHFTL